jgi:RNA polymerase sigma-70 factor (ECF subfamily)
MAMRRLFLLANGQKGVSAKYPSYLQLRKLSDEDLVENLKNGHEDALAVLFDRYHRFVYSIALTVLRDPGEAEDLAQEVFFEIYRSVGDFDPAKGTAKAWIRLRAYHRSLNRWHSLNARRHYDSEKISDLGRREPANGSRRWAGLSCQECTHLIAQGMATLNEKQRGTLELAWFRGLLMRDIAAQTNESLPNVRHYYYRGLQRLRSFLQGDQPLVGPAARRQEAKHVK